MRLHDLSITAFGPFAGTVHVDFDELNEAGLFLLTGATGAGKSSLLDAVCFALYGTVPGARGVKTLKSQHSPSEARPEVRLDFTVQGRRFVVRRTPEWTRPKRRGAGLLIEKASASLMETTGGNERFLSSRAAEVGLQVGSLMGMNASQFVQVALLPQGEFQTFLRASSQDRHDVLQQLFRTDRFARIETWVSDHSRRLVEQSGTGRSTVQRLLDTVADRAGLTTPDDLSGDSLAAAAADERVLPWVATVLEEALSEAELALARDEEARAAAQEARRRHHEAARAAERRRRRDAARAALAALEASEPDARAAREVVDHHQRAQRCRPVLDLVDRARAAHQEACADRDRALQALAARRPTRMDPHLVDARDPTVASVARLSELVEAVRSRIARLEAVLPREQVALDARRARDAARARLRVAEEDLREVEVRTDAVPSEIASRVAALAVEAARADPQGTLRSLLETARARLDAASRLEEVRPELQLLDDGRRAARDRMQDAREHQQDLVARRLAGMAAELAGDLEEGVPCQVCGSIAHPRRAEASLDAVTEQDHRRAEQLLSAAAVVLETADEAFLDLRRRHDGLVVSAAGRTVEQATEQVAGLERQAAEAESARLEHARLEDELRALREEQAVLGRRRTAVAATVAALHESVSAHERVLEAAASEIGHALGGGTTEPPPTGSLVPAVADLTAWCAALLEAQHATAALEAADARLSEVSAQALAAAAEQGFDSLEDIEAARVPDDALERLVGQLRRRAHEEGRVHAVLDDPELADPGDDAGEDLAELAARVARTDSDAADTARRLALHEDRASALGGLLDRIGAAMEAWAPVRDESLRAESISRLVRGMGHDNELQMRLSAYVLATRLDQVVDAANERLGHLRDQRYLLQRTGRAERRSAQAGLGLEIVDQWTGDVRAPSTLSGGETFVVSLSLALGLADVVTHESGGTEIETLFVDEGFGTLDADTLDDVMDRLDGLRAGGRTVGVVSHVTELRSRIATQVHVDKGRSGSTVTVHTLVG